ncbi:unnamed protein product [Prorocentrum cordatum]|uniref:Uncharacterized protein n=1 Tax=Prorocentrum cordatum TaxID=2364126 RepID=A0ABN9UN41_9DINO|nr:unnamed protein product [Polarella glacialis]
MSVGICAACCCGWLLRLAAAAGCRGWLLRLAAAACSCGWLLRHLAVTGYFSPLTLAEEEVWHDYGLALWHVGRREEAVQNFQNAITTNPAFPKGYNNLGCALVLLGLSATPANAQTVQQGLQAMEQAISLLPSTSPRLRPKVDFLKKTSGARRNGMNGDEMISTCSDGFVKRLEDKRVTLVEHQLHDEKGNVLEDIQIRWEKKAVALKGNRAAWVEDGAMKYDGEGL